MDWLISFELGLIFVLLVFSAFFSSAETSLFSLTISQLDQMDRDENPQAGLIKKLLRQPRRVIVTILIGNEFVNVTASAVAASLVIRWAGPGREWVNLLIMVPVLLVVGEITPKTLAIRNNVAFATFQAPLINRFAALIRPLRWIVRYVADWFITLLVGAERTRANIVTEDMVRVLTREALGQGELDEREVRYIEDIFAFGDATVRQVMTPRSQVFALPISTPLDALAAEMQRTRYSKIPVYDGEPDNIMGILFVRDLLKTNWAMEMAGSGAPAGSEEAPVSGPEDLTALLRPVYFVPESRSAADLFHTFRKKQISIALTIDEYGGVTGLVTMEDLLECIFGAIPSRSDTASDNQMRWEELGQRQYRTDGRLTLEQLEELIGLRIDDDEADTLGGFLLKRLGELPAPGTQVVEGRLQFTVEEVTDRRISSVLLAVSPSATDETEERGADPSSGEEGA